MELILVAITAICMFGLSPGSVRGPRNWPAWRNRLTERVTVESVQYVHGPRVGTADYLVVDNDRLPPYQICALVLRDAQEGGDYTLPYQRAFVSEDDRTWLYTQGWTHDRPSGRVGAR